jgi:hypothetical protein
MNLNFLKNKRIMAFLAIAIVISVTLIYAIIDSIEFMENTITTTSELGVGNKGPAVRFNFDKLKEIGIIR